MTTQALDQLVGVGTGVDLVHIPTFGEQLAQPGSVFAQVFTDREWAYAHRPENAGPGRAESSLAARWAAKEAAVKAWSSLILGRPPVIDPAKLDWAEIEVRHDKWGRPYYQFHGDVAGELETLARRRNARLQWSLSLSHDGNTAIAVAAIHATGVLSCTVADRFI